MKNKLCPFTFYKQKILIQVHYNSYYWLFWSKVFFKSFSMNYLKFLVDHITHIICKVGYWTWQQKIRLLTNLITGIVGWPIFRLMRSTSVRRSSGISYFTIARNLGFSIGTRRRIFWGMKMIGRRILLRFSRTWLLRYRSRTLSSPSSSTRTSSPLWLGDSSAPTITPPVCIWFSYK